MELGAETQFFLIYNLQKTIDIWLLVCYNNIVKWESNLPLKGYLTLYIVYKRNFQNTVDKSLML